MQQKKSGEIPVYDLKSFVDAYSRQLVAQKRKEPVPSLFLPKESLEKFVGEYLSIYRGTSIIITAVDVRKIMRSLLRTYLSEDQVSLLEKNADAATELG